jgi:hypothetical protein
MAQYTVYFFKDETIKIPDKYHPNVDRIKDIDYDGDDGGMQVGDVRNDDSFALKLASQYWRELRERIESSDSRYLGKTEDMISLVTNDGVLKAVFSDENPYKKILVKKVL